MLRSLTYALAASTLATIAIAPTAAADEQVNLNIQLDVSKISDSTSADKALKSLERQAKKACSYDINATKRTKTDWECVNEVVEQVVTHFDAPLLTSAYANSDMAVRIADTLVKGPAQQ